MLFGQAIPIYRPLVFAVRHLCRGCPDPLVFAFIVLSILKEEQTYRYLPKPDCCWDPALQCALLLSFSENEGHLTATAPLLSLVNRHALLRVTHKASNSTIEASKIVFFFFEWSKIVCVTVLCSKPCGTEANRLLKPPNKWTCLAKKKERDSWALQSNPIQLVVPSSML